MNTDELRAALEYAEVVTGGMHHDSRYLIARALLHLHEQNAALREEIDALTGQHERDERENAELRRVLQDVLYWADGYYGADIIQCRRDTAEARRLLAVEVQDA